MLSPVSRMKALFISTAKAPNDLDAADRKGIEVDPKPKRLKEATSSIRTARLKK